MKKELLRCVDKIPAYCHQLMFTSRSLAVGQSACCRKVSVAARPVEKMKAKKPSSTFFHKHATADHLTLAPLACADDVEGGAPGGTGTNSRERCGWGPGVYRMGKGEGWKQDLCG